MMMQTNLHQNLTLKYLLCRSVGPKIGQIFVLAVAFLLVVTKRSRFLNGVKGFSYRELDISENLSELFGFLSLTSSLSDKKN